MGAARLHLAYSPYYAADLAEIDYAQTANTIYIAHLDYTLQKLTRDGHTDWTAAEVTFGPLIAAPANVAATPTQPNATGAIATDYTYQVTALDSDGQESRASDPDTASNDLSLQGNYNTVTWDAVTDAAVYFVYRGDNSARGYIGQVLAPTVSFKDRNLLSVLSDTPPLATNPFATINNYPSTLAFHQQRLYPARTRARPNAIYASKPADPENMDKAQITRPDDALAFALFTDKVNSVNHLVSMKKELIALTGDSIISITGGEGGAITPAAIMPERETARGASRLKPIVVDKVIFYEPAKVAGMRALGFTFEVDGYQSNDVSIFSPQYFKGKRVVDWAYQEAPYSCVWLVMDDGGDLLCFTWEEEQQVWGFTDCSTSGYVERVAVIAENGADRLYALIRRTIDKFERRFHERLALPHVTDREDACHLDCAVTQVSDVASDIIDQLWHLEGETVSATYDGWVIHDLVVENGQVTLPHAGYIRTAGLRYTGYIETLPPILGPQHVARANVGDVTVRAIDTRGLEVSTDGAIFDPFPEREGADPQLLPEGGLHDLTIPAQGHWVDGVTLHFRQTEPLPAHLVAIFYDAIVPDEARE